MLKETILQKSFAQHLPDENEFKEFLKRSVTYIDDIAALPTAAVAYLDQAYNSQGITYVCKEVSTGVYDWAAYDTSGQSLHYPDATGKPTLNGVPLNGTLTSSSVGVAPDSTGRTAITDPSAKNILINDDSLITYENLAAALNTLFDVANLPKYEKQYNPILTSDGTVVTWIVTHSCKNGEPIIQMFTKEGDQMNLDTITLTNLEIRHLTSKRIEIEWDSAINIAANEYYVVLIG